MNSPTHLNLASLSNSQQRLTVVANAPKEGEQGPTLSLEVAGTDRNSIVLSIEEARALSLAIISVVNKHEQHAHVQRKQILAPVALHPVTR